MEILKKIIDNLEKVRGENIVCYDMRGYSPLFDYMIIATVDSERQSDACCSYIAQSLAEEGMSVNHIEGKNSAWVLVDCKDIIVHIFTTQERAHYALEKIYMDIPKMDIANL